MLCFFIFAAAISGRQGLFGSRVATFDDGEDAQQQEEYYSGFGGFEPLAPEEDVADSDDFGTSFDRNNDTAENVYHHQGYQSRTKRPVNIRPATVVHGAPVRRRGGKHLRLPLQDQRLNAPYQQNQEKMAGKNDKRKRTTKSGGSTAAGATTRSETENERLKAELAEKEKELQDFKRRADQLEKEKNVPNKKVKKEKRKVEEKKEMTGTWCELEEAFKAYVYPSIKFMRKPEDEYDVMLLSLQHTNEWPKLKDLEGEELEDEVNSYLKVYAGKMSHLMNQERSQHQSALRTKWIEDNKIGVAPTAAQLLKVARRNPKYLQILDEEGGTPEENQKNKEINAENKKYRDRFKIYYSNYVPTCSFSSTWSKDIQTQHLLSSYKDKDGEDMVPPSVEAMVILFLENNEKKWEWQTGVCMDHKNVSTYKDALKVKLKAEKRDPRDDEIEPSTKYSSSDCGAKSYGGWSDAGKLQHLRLTKFIEEARALETTKEIEENCRKELIEDLKNSGKKKKKGKDSLLDVPEEEEDEEEEDLELGYESCDSEAEAAEMKKFQFLTKAKKKQQEQEMQRQKEKQQQEEEARKRDQNKEGSGGSTVESEGDGKENDGGKPTGKKGGREKSPPQQQQQTGGGRASGRRGGGRSSGS